MIGEGFLLAGRAEAIVAGTIGWRRLHWRRIMLDATRRLTKGIQ